MQLHKLSEHNTAMTGDLQPEQHTIEPAHIHDDANTFHWFSPGMYVIYAIAFGFAVWCVKWRIKSKA